MTSLSKRSPAAWFAEAARCYVEGHQACAWCGDSHCVFQTEHGSRLEYSCNSCDFYVCLDRQAGQYHATAGTSRAAANAS
ncbi:MAG TPA: hypothetical protein VKE94_00440 [Gemmataceae bacterium]|nr:hypothetical protein [Gemmataceae bacterium]